MQSTSIKGGKIYNDIDVGSFHSEVTDFLGLGHLPAVLIVTSTQPIPVLVHTQAHPAKPRCAAATDHVLAGLSMLNYHTATGTSSVLGSHVNFQLVAVLLVVEPECFVPDCFGKEIFQEFALLIATVLIRTLFPGLEAHVAKISEFARRTHNSVGLEPHFADLLLAPGALLGELLHPIHAESLLEFLSLLFGENPNLPAILEVPKGIALHVIFVSVRAPHFKFIAGNKRFDKNSHGIPANIVTALHPSHPFFQSDLINSLGISNDVGHLCYVSLVLGYFKLSSNHNSDVCNPDIFAYLGALVVERHGIGMQGVADVVENVLLKSLTSCIMADGQLSFLIVDGHYPDFEGA